MKSKKIEGGEPKPETNPFSKLSNPAQRALANAGITNLQQLAKLTEKEFMVLHGIGKGSLPVVQKAMEEKGLGFKK